MNIKHILLIPGAIALALSCVPVLPVFAQTEPAPTVQPRQRANKLNLTEAQQAQIKQIREETKAAIENILTPEQKAQLQTMKQSGQKMRGGFKSLNLTDAQKEQMRAIKQNSQQKIQAILTPEQREMMQQRRQGMQQRRQQMRQSGT